VKYGKDGGKIAREVDAHDWIKMHILTGVKTNVVTGVEITGRYESDFTQLEPLVEQTAKNFDMNEVSADEGYSSLNNHEVIDLYGATPYIAFKSNATGAAGGLFEKMFAVFTPHCEFFLAHYHKRSNVETTFHMIKSQFGSRLRSKTAVAQTNEALAKVLCHNLCWVIQSMFEFGIEPGF
jgi:transposase